MIETLTNLKNNKIKDPRRGPATGGGLCGTAEEVLGWVGEEVSWYVFLLLSSAFLFVFLHPLSSCFLLLLLPSRRRKGGEKSGRKVEASTDMVE